MDEKTRNAYIDKIRKNNRILNKDLIEELEKKPIKFTLMSPSIRNIRYIITNVPFQISDFYFQETYGFTDLKRLSKW